MFFLFFFFFVVQYRLSNSRPVQTKYFLSVSSICWQSEIGLDDRLIFLLSFPAVQCLRFGNRKRMQLRNCYCKIKWFRDRPLRGSRYSENDEREGWPHDRDQRTDWENINYFTAEITEIEIQFERKREFQRPNIEISFFLTLSII